MRIPFLGGSGKKRSVTVNASRTVNLYPVVDPESKSPVALYGTPGLTRLADTTTGEGRGIYEASGRLFVVVGATLYEIDANGTVTRFIAFLVMNISCIWTIVSSGVSPWASAPPIAAPALVPP